MFGDKMLPREKLIKYGPDFLDESELLAILLGSGSHEENVFDLAKRIVDSTPSLREFLNFSYEELIQIKGVKEAKATKIMASIELAKRIFQYQPENISLTNPKDIYETLKYEFQELVQEKFMVLYLDKRVHLIRQMILAIGDQNMINVDVKALLRNAVRFASPNIVLIHNHPSNSLKPSQADIECTKRIVAAAKQIDICVLDHLIITNYGYFSFVENHIL